MIAIIPARGGSKRLPNKNVKELLGKPLIAHTIECALKAKSVERVMLSTDDEEIASIARDYNIEIPFMRPARLATDNAKVIDNFIYTIDRLNGQFNQDISEFVVLQTTSPLREPEDVDDSIELFRKKNADSVISVCEAHYPPTSAIRVAPTRLISNYFTIKHKVNAQTEKAYTPNGAVYVFKYSLLKNKYSYIFDKTYAHIMPHERSIDIDTMLDFKFAEFMMQR
jgi:CMP-N,N'-diacetyllegionaminic acid synthase